MAKVPWRKALILFQSHLYTSSHQHSLWMWFSHILHWGVGGTTSWWEWASFNLSLLVLMPQLFLIVWGWVGASFTTPYINVWPRLVWKLGINQMPENQCTIWIHIQWGQKNLTHSSWSCCSRSPRTLPCWVIELFELITESTHLSPWSFTLPGRLGIPVLK